MNQTLRVAVLLADGQSREQVGVQTGLSASQVKLATERLEAVAERISHDDETGPQ
jgi:hypothetical protein